MSSSRSKFEGTPRERPRGWLSRIIIQNFSPDEYYNSILDIDLQKLKEEGIRGLLIDLDNTLLPWYSYTFDEKVKNWIKRAKEMGFKICVVSNGLAFRVKKLCEELDVPYIPRAVKPRLKGIKKALKILGLPQDQVVIIGDQIFTDIWAANKMGIRSILVKPVSKWEFVTTYLIRFLERGLIKWLQKQGFLNKFE